MHPLQSPCPALLSRAPRRSHPSTHAPQSSLHYPDPLPLLGARTPPRGWAGEPPEVQSLGRRRLRGTVRARSRSCCDKEGWVPRAHLSRRVCVLQLPSPLPKRKKTSPAPTFRREEAAPPAVPAVAAAAAAAAAAPHAQRQQERHQAQPPRQHPLAAAEPPPPPPTALAGLARRCPPVPAAPRSRCWVRRRRRRPHPRPPAALRRAARSLSPSLARSPANSSTHWRGPGAAPALTPGRPVTSRREGRWLVAYS
nr:serine/arginine repetitive matrix protein 1-like [Meriones unguiculatus]